jgi:hypothetical protein
MWNRAATNATGAVGLLLLINNCSFLNIVVIYYYLCTLIFYHSENNLWTLSDNVRHFYVLVNIIIWFDGIKSNICTYKMTHRTWRRISINVSAVTPILRVGCHHHSPRYVSCGHCVQTISVTAACGNFSSPSVPAISLVSSLANCEVTFWPLQMFTCKLRQFFFLYLHPDLNCYRFSGEGDYRLTSAEWREFCRSFLGALAWRILWGCE